MVLDNVATSSGMIEGARLYIVRNSTNIRVSRLSSDKEMSVVLVVRYQSDQRLISK